MAGEMRKMGATSDLAISEIRKTGLCHNHYGDFKVNRKEITLNCLQIDL